MTDRYDALTVRKDKDGKNRYTKIGALFRAKEGDSFWLDLSALPIPNEEGKVRMVFYPPREKDGERTASGRAGNSSLDDEIPF